MPTPAATISHPLKLPTATQDPNVYTMTNMTTKSTAFHWVAATKLPTLITSNPKLAPTLLEIYLVIILHTVPDLMTHPAIEPNPLLNDFTCQDSAIFFKLLDYHMD